MLAAAGLVSAGGFAAWVFFRPVSTAQETGTQETGAAAAAPLSSDTLTDTLSTSAEDIPTLLGHRQYALANPTELVPFSKNVEVKLRPSAAQKLEAMVAQAQAEGIQLKAISGFRSLEDQHYLFFDRQAELAQTPTVRAEVSAPPGYSEHHTGYAVDLGDATQPQTHLEVSFEQTPAFAWLQKNAARYGFELSFPKDHAEGLSYEPWHWRFIGDQQSLETFYKE
ncbi:MAG: D-alanyl-D-alanine carboxypeptidase family protein [Leptolyngbya sp. SIO4C1]|nr:D-alanyl-D-alanine carboxypeptidase family protein [Leptolyngbya sp. SIO4C1]